MSNNKYKIPTMAEINAIKWNGFNVASTFSGGGGSCLGYRMAGYRVVYMNEFVKEARNTYEANSNGTYIDDRDIRNVHGQDILDATNLKSIDILDGSPPCCAFSTAGIREKGWNQRRAYSDGKSQKIDDLFFEYSRIVEELKPKVFVAENVSGLVEGVAKGYFKNILRSLKSNGYNVKAKVLNSKYLGVPQTRKRLIFIGVRNDIGIEPIFPKPHGPILTVGDAFINLIQDEEQRLFILQKQKEYAVYKKMLEFPQNPLKPISYAQLTGSGTGFNLIRLSENCPSPTLMATSDLSNYSLFHYSENRKLTIPEMKRLESLPDDFILTGSYRKQAERIGRMVPPIMMKEISETIYREILCKI